MMVARMESLTSARPIPAMIRIGRAGIVDMAKGEVDPDITAHYVRGFNATFGDEIEAALEIAWQEVHGCTIEETLRSEGAG